MGCSAAAQNAVNGTAAAASHSTRLGLSKLSPLITAAARFSYGSMRNTPPCWSARPPRSERKAGARASKPTSGSWYRRRASASTAPGSLSTPAIASGSISSPRSVFATLRPGRIVSANACSVASSGRSAAIAGSAAIMRSATGSAARTIAPAPSSAVRRMKSRRESSRSTIPMDVEPTFGQGPMLRFMRALLVAALLLAGCAAIAAAPAGAQGPSGWDGKNPFVCTLQQVGTGTDFPQPNADPFCVEFDKTHQNVDKLGVVDFLSKEPARVAAASPKCFYFQSDHWRGTVSESAPQSETYAWDGHYYFNKATGAGGAYVENFRIGGQSGDPTTVPGFPEEYKKYFSNGRGGVQAAGDVQADPRCATKPNPSGPSGGGGSPTKECRVAGGRIRRGIDKVNLGMKRAAARRAQGMPATESPRKMTWCLDGGGGLTAALRSATVEVVWTNSRPFSTERVHTSSRSQWAR